MSKSTSVSNSSLERFTLDFEFDRTWHQAKEHTKKRAGYNGEK